VEKENLLKHGAMRPQSDRSISKVTPKMFFFFFFSFFKVHVSESVRHHVIINHGVEFYILLSRLQS